jgi:hypothetical protein
VPTRAGRRIAIAVVLLVLAGAGALAASPRGAGAVRLGPLSLLWWCAAVAGPAVSVGVTVAALARRRPSGDRDSSAAPPA